MTTVVECVECGDRHPMTAREWGRRPGRSACPVCGAFDYQPAMLG